MHIKIGTRGSKLAMAQTTDVCNRLKKAYPEHTFEIVVISTKGDRIQNVALNQIGDKGLFVKEIEEQLIKGEIQLAVHSMKDMPSRCEEGLAFTKTWKREDPRDVLILSEKNSWEELPKGAVIGTGSLRRAYQLQQLRPDIKIVNIRGNVDTRLRKMKEQQLDGIVLAAAGLNRLGMNGVITQYLESNEMIPACAQGALALEIKMDNTVLRDMLDVLSDEKSQIEVLAERIFLDEMDGSCHVPVGASCKVFDKGESLPDGVIATSQICMLRTIYGNEDGTELVQVETVNEDPIEAGRVAAEEVKRIMRQCENN